MKTKLTLLALCVGITGAVASAAESRVDVVFNQPENFRDVKDSDPGSDKDRDSILEEIKVFIGERAVYYVPEGQKLAVTFSDIDMAGDFEPGRGAAANDVRIVRDIYPPRMVLSFKLTDVSGTVLKEGERKLNDMFFLSKISMFGTSDPLRYEKTLLDDWLRDDFPKAKKKK